MGPHTMEFTLILRGKYLKQTNRQINAISGEAGWTLVRNNTSRGGARIRVPDRDRPPTVCAIFVLCRL